MGHKRILMHRIWQHCMTNCVIKVVLGGKTLEVIGQFFGMDRIILLPPSGSEQEKGKPKIAATA